MQTEMTLTRFMSMIVFRYYDIICKVEIEIKSNEKEEKGHRLQYRLEKTNINIYMTKIL